MTRRPWILLVCLAGCAPRSAARPPATESVASSVPATESSRATNRVVNVVGEKNAFWSPWTLPQITLPTPPMAVPGIPLPWPASTAANPPTPPPPAPHPPTVTPPAPASPTPSTVTPPSKAPQVILYGATWCPACKQAQAHLEGRSIAYVYKDVDQDANAQELAIKIQPTGETNVALPVTDVDGELLIGWSQKRFDEIYDAKAK